MIENVPGSARMSRPETGMTGMTGVTGVTGVSGMTGTTGARVVIRALLGCTVLLAACGDDGSASTPSDAQASDAAPSSQDAAIDAPPLPLSPIKINEVMPSNTASCADELGGFADWIELYNPSDAVIDLGGYTATDDVMVPLKSTLLPGLTIAAHGYLVLWADDDIEQGNAHLGFKLAAAAEAFALFDPGQRLVDTMSWTNAANDIAIARFPDGTGDFMSCAHATCAATNGAACPP